MEELYQVPQQTVVVLLFARDLNDGRDALVIDIRSEKCIGILAAFAEGDLHDDRSFVAIGDGLLVLAPAEGAVHEEFRLRRPSFV